MTRANVSVLILTHNEEINLEDCLESVVGWVREICIIDSGSTDKTLEIARKYTENIFHLPFKDFGASRNWGLDHVKFESDWVLVLDADERVPPELRAEIMGILADDGRGMDGYYINKKYIFYGKWIKHCGFYPAWNMRLWRHERGRYEKRANHNHVILRGPAGYCKSDIIHEDRRDWLFMVSKQARFSQDEAGEYLRSVRGEGQGEIKPKFFGTPVERKRWMKTIFARLPARPLVKFLYFYVWKRGFLDGRMGLRFCIMWAMFEYVTSFHVWEQTHFKQGAPRGGIEAPRYYKAEGGAPTVPLARDGNGLRSLEKAAAEGGRPWP